jgi:hypothetical protein
VHIHGPVRIGFMHLHHLTPEPPSYEFLYPDFLSLVYVAHAGEIESERVPDDYEQEAVFRSVADARALLLHVDSEYFLAGSYASRWRAT